jgi:hypothetical protein
MDQPDREYPEISYTLISHVVEGLLGFEPNAPENSFLTVSRLPRAVTEASVQNIPLGSHRIHVLHHGVFKSTATHASGDNPLKWQAHFYGNHSEITVNGERRLAKSQMIHGVKAIWGSNMTLSGSRRRRRFRSGSMRTF